MLLIATAFISNVVILFCVETSITIVIILGAISIFVPNGYLLYNFAGTLLVDLSQHASKVLFLSSTLGVNIIWLLGNITIILLANYSSEGLPGEHVIRDQETQYKFVMGMNIGLVTAGVLASVLAI